MKYPRSKLTTQSDFVKRKIVERMVQLKHMSTEHESVAAAILFRISEQPHFYVKTEPERKLLIEELTTALDYWVRSAPHAVDSVMSKWVHRRNTETLNVFIGKLERNGS